MVVRGLENSALDDREKTLFRFVEKVHHRAQQITAQDMQPSMRPGGTMRRSITSSPSARCSTSTIGGWAPAGVHVLSDEAHRLAGKRSAETGYIRK